MAILGALVHVNVPSGRTLLALAPLFLLIIGIVIYSLVDLVRAESVRYLPKPVWAVIIVVGSVPVGAVAYLLFGKDRSGEHHGAVDGSAHGRA